MGGSTNGWFYKWVVLQSFGAGAGLRNILPCELKNIAT
jgi:hypothetical protein